MELQRGAGGAGGRGRGEERGARCSQTGHRDAGVPCEVLRSLSGTDGFGARILQCEAGQTAERVAMILPVHQICGGGVVPRAAPVAKGVEERIALEAAVGV